MSRMEQLEYALNNYFDILLKNPRKGSDASYMISESDCRKTARACEYISYRANLDITNLNAASVMAGLGKWYRCSVKDVTSAFDRYIAAQPDSLWLSLSLSTPPSAEEMIEFIVSNHIEEISKYAGRNFNCPYISFEAMIFNTVIIRWRKQWEATCSFRIRLYGIYNEVCEELDFDTKDEAVSFAEDRVRKAPDKYSRYVVLIKTPFNKEHYLVYTLLGGFSTKHIRRKRDGSEVWKSLFYDYTDREIFSTESSVHPAPVELMRLAVERDAMYVVLSCSCNDETRPVVQYFKVDRQFHCNDFVDLVQRMFFDNISD